MKKQKNLLSKGTFLILLALSISMTSCSSLSSYSTDVQLNPSQNYAKTKTSEVIIYLSKEDLPADYEKVGVVLAGGLLKGKIKKARRDAARMGANGLYWEGFNNNRGNYSISGDTIVVNSQADGEYLIAIRTK
jgi:hypothetical protein